MIEPELKVWTEDLLDLAPSIPDCSVDVVVTSPPYKRRDGYSNDLMQALGEVLQRVLRPGGRVYMNFGQLREDFDRPFVAQGLVKEWSGLEVGQTIAWVKSMAIPTWRKLVQEELRRIKGQQVHGVESVIKRIQRVLDGPGEFISRGHSTTITLKSPTLTYCWEPIFTFYKPPELQLNRLSIGCAYADKTNLTRGTRGKNGDVKCAGDTWWIPYETTGAKKKKATAGMSDAYAFPIELPLKAIQVSNIAKGCVVLDPFMGSGTTALAAKRLGMHAWGVERDARKVKQIQQSWEKEPVGDGQRQEEEVDVREVR